MLVLLTSEFSGVGGIQQSGREAWRALERLALRIGSVKRGLFVLGDGRLPPCDSNYYVVSARGSKLKALEAAVLSRWRPRLLLCWHVNLLPLALLLRAPNSRVVAFLHGIEAWRKLKPHTRLAARRVTGFLSNSDFTWRRFIEYNPEFAPVPHRTVSLGFGEASRRIVWNERATARKRAALMVGRLSAGEDYKGHREMLRAWHLVLERVPEAQLWIVGSGELRPELSRLAEALGLKACVRFFGRVSESRKEWLIRRAHCLAMPSRAEGFGLVYLEAMRLGRPCLVSDCDAGREVVNPPEAGLAVDPDDAEALAAATARLLTGGQEWEKWSRQARVRYQGYFTAEHFRGRLMKACYDCLSSQ